ncbi:MAG: SAM-dependent methyltransferase [Butyrivibrio sp.]|nr:SAM-dependent methyltransferase [Butyrivibrio sp.]
MTNRNNNDVALKMSVRLKEIAELLRGSAELKAADVGCDHGYVSIYLVTHGIASSCIAMDVRKGPLSGAKDNVAEYGFSEVITTRLSDGLKELKKDEANALVIAGMGGNLMRRILEEGKPKELGIEVAVLQPQSDIADFRQFLRDNGYQITDEKVIEEDGKFYFPIKVTTERESTSKGDMFESACRLLKKANAYITDEQILRICNRYGECNILNKDETLKKFLLHGKKVCEAILKSLDEKEHADRLSEIICELSDVDTVLEIFLN